MTAATANPAATGEREYRSRRRQLLLAASLVAAYVATFSVVLEPDPVSHVKPVPSKYLWQAIPFAILTAVLIWRAFRARTVSPPDGLHGHRVLSHWLPR